MLVPLTAAAALVFAGYHTMGPLSQLYGETFLGEGPGSRRLALTFDDGPDDPHTLRLLEVLARYQVRATFFMIGSHVAQHPNIARAVAEEGHTIGNHTYSHPLLIFRSRAGVTAELRNCTKALEDAVGRHARIFRPPYGGRRPATLRAIRAEGHQPVMWSVPGYDWRTQDAEKIASNVRRQLRGGDIILLHDGAPGTNAPDRSGTIQATEQLIRRCKDDGYQFVTVPEMMTGTLARC